MDIRREAEAIWASETNSLPLDLDLEPLNTLREGVGLYSRSYQTDREPGSREGSCSRPGAILPSKLPDHDLAGLVVPLVQEG